MGMVPGFKDKKLNLEPNSRVSELGALQGHLNKHELLSRRFRPEFETLRLII